MKQMTASQARVVRRVRLEDILCGFFRGPDEKVYLAFSHGKESCTCYFPVLEDGRISQRSGPENFIPVREVEIINPADVGISKISWTKEVAEE